MSARLPSMHALKTFESAARLKSFKAAADELNVSPTAISHQIRDLEQELGTCLFARGFRTVMLTTEGQKLADVCTLWMSELKQTIAEIKTLPKTITISTTNAFATMWLVPNLTDFKILHPQIDVVIKANDALIDIKNDMRFDLVIRYGVIDRENENIAILTQDRMGLFVTQLYWDRLNIQESVDVYLTSWKNKSLSKPEYLNLLQQVWTNHLVKLHYFEDENQVIQAALTGQGVAIVSKHLVQHHVMRGWLVEKYSDQIKLDSELSYYLILPKRSLKNNSVQHFQAWIKSKF